MGKGYSRNIVILRGYEHQRHPLFDPREAQGAADQRCLKARQGPAQRAGDSVYCWPVPTASNVLGVDADTMFVKDWLGHKSIQSAIVYSQLTSRTRDEQARKVFTSPRIIEIDGERSC